jgi:LPS-assembly protein
MKIPVTVTADKLDYDRATDVYVAVGHVKIEQEGVRLEADKVVMNNRTGEAVAEGRVYLQDGDDVIQADKMQINLSTRGGVITKGDMFMKKDNLHVKGDTIERRSETVYHVENGFITTCDEDEWYLKADELNIDMDRYATGRGVSFNMIGLPVFYTPYFLFPVRRQSGLLIPELGYSSSDGFFANNEIFWAISDYKDMTLYSDYREQVGHGTGVEYRYLNSRESSGEMYYKYFDLYHAGESRWNFRLLHQEEFAEDLSARADINLVSDERYFMDLERKL